MTITTPRVEVPRDHLGRPLITPPGGGKPVPYTRATTWAKTLEDTFKLEQWGKRMVAIGLADRPDLLMAVSVNRGDKERMNHLCDDAIEAAKASAAATVGTNMHQLADMVDRGDELPTVTAEVLADLAAYEEATRGLEVVAMEQFVVIDELQVAGTFDRIYRVPAGGYIISDLKTGNVDWAMGSIAIQLALYSRGVAYDPATGGRTPLPDVDQDTALVVHLPAGQGTCRILEVNIALGWEAALIAGRVRRYRNYSKKGLHVEVTG